MNFSVKKIMQCMICTGVFLFFLGLPAHAQNITLTKNDFTLNDLFSEIRKQSGYDFVYTTTQFNTKKNVTVKSKNASLRQLLDELFAGQEISYVIRNKTIIITEKQTGRTETIEGFVGDSKTRKPLALVTVTIKGTRSVVQTNQSGRFSISVPPGAKSLEFAYLGYKKAQTPIAVNSDYRVYLEEEEMVLDETVITGIVERKEGSFTGSTKTITATELKRVSSNNVFAAVAALDPAFRIVQNNVTGGNINQLPDIQMRGSNSFPNLSTDLSSNPNAPLFILDGFEATLQRIVDLDMNLIASITLLKDASATSIYGSRGANGVMVVTTIVPQPGKIQITFNNDFRLTTPDLSVYNLLGSKEKLDFEKRAGVYSSSSYSAEYLYNERYKAMYSGVNTNWLKLPVQNGYSNRSSLWLGGGDEAVRYAVQFSGDLASGVMKGQNRKNYSGQFDLTYRIKQLQFSNSIRVFQNRSNESPYGSFSDYVSLNPYWAPYNENGTTKALLENIVVPGVSSRIANPLMDVTYNTIDKAQYFGVSNNTQIRYTPKPYLFFETRFNLAKQNGSADEFYSALDSRFLEVTDLNKKGIYNVRNDNSNSYESLTTGNLNLPLGRHQIFSSIGFNMASTGNNYYQMNTQGFPFDRLDNLLFAAQYEANSKPSGEESTTRRIGFLYSGNYTYDNRYMADFSIRRDGSSQFGSAKRFGTFWSTGIGWNIHNEKFFASNELVNRLKLRASYGSTGSLNIPAYSSQFRYNFGTNTSYYGELGATLAGLGNANLSWQQVLKANIGIDAILFKERLDLRFDVYREITKNALTQLSLAPSTGFSTYSENLGQLQNKGLEFSARYKLMEDRRTGLLWSVNVNGFTNKNILKKLSNKLKASNERLNTANPDQRRPNVQFNEGESMTTIYVVRSLGIDQVTGAEVYLTKDGNKTFDWNAADKVASGDTTPKWNGNFGTNFNYKGFELGLILNYQYGGQLYNQTLIDRVESVNPRNNVDRRAYDLGWAKPGDISQYRRITTDSYNTPTKLTSRFVQDNDILNLSSASLGYNFRQNAFIKKIGLRSLQLTAITNDVFRISTIETERGTDNPFARTYSLSLRAGF